MDYRPTPPPQGEAEGGVGRWKGDEVWWGSAGAVCLVAYRRMRVTVPGRGEIPRSVYSFKLGTPLKTTRPICLMAPGPCWAEEEEDAGLTAQQAGRAEATVRTCSYPRLWCV